MTGCWAWLRGKIARSPSQRPRSPSPGRPARPKDGPRPLPNPQDRSAISESLRPEHDTRASAPSAQPPSSPSPEDISIPVVSPVPDQERSSAHPVSKPSGTQSNTRTSDVATGVSSQSSTRFAAFWSKLRNFVGVVLRLVQPATENVPPAKAVIASVIEILKIVDVSCIVFHLYF